ncbi:MAG TPA: hypothetical protein VFJ96_12105 [Gemmatimonadaceae bacterium]|nr:hypothetical protein [Gemmatimonadaceae bacterium]
MRARLFSRRGRCALVVLIFGVARCRSDHAPDAKRSDTAAARAVEPSTTPIGSATAAVAVVRDYYAAIDAHDYRRAYLAWEQEGAASGQSFAAFRRGFDSTVSVAVQLGAPSRIDGAAGSRYVTVPVQITARTTGGAVQHFAGTYTLRRAVVTGATPEQRTWHIYSAKVTAR